MNPRDFWDQATQLSAVAEEAAQRSAMSRAYYAALNRAALYLEKRGTELPPDGRYHEVVSSGIGTDFPGLESQLIDLMARRGAADYSVWHAWENDVDDAVQISARIISMLESKDP